MIRIPQAKFQRTALFTGLGCLLFIALAGALWPNSQAGEEPADTHQQAMITTETVVHIQNYYPLCGHLEEQTINSNSSFSGLDEGQLQQQGYALIWQDGEVYLSCEKTGYCLADGQKCHLRIHQGGISIFSGPLNGNGELRQQLDIPFSALPARWLAQLTAGGIEFPDEETLLMALDNLDEMLEYE